MHISYEYKTYITYIEIDNSSSRSSLVNIDKHISALRQEEEATVQVCVKLSQFVKKNSLIPYNDDILEYIRYFIREEEMKRSSNAKNDDVIQGLQNMIKEYERIQLLYDSVPNDRTTDVASISRYNRVGPEDIFGIVTQLYKLPINGRSIRDQVEELKRKQLRANEQKEHFVSAPSNANSTIMQQLKHIVDKHQ